MQIMGKIQILGGSTNDRRLLTNNISDGLYFLVNGVNHLIKPIPPHPKKLVILVEIVG